jgi:hypothetical protein
MLCAGLPPSTVLWYRDKNYDNIHIPMEFTKENLVRESDISYGDYYILPEDLDYLRKDNVYIAKFDDLNVLCNYIWPTFDLFEAHELL